MNPKQSFWSWIKEFFEPYKSSIRVQMMITMFFTFYIIYWQVTHDKIDMSLIALLLVASFAPKLIEKFASKTVK